MKQEKADLVVSWPFQSHRVGNGGYTTYLFGSPVGPVAVLDFGIAPMSETTTTHLEI